LACAEARRPSEHSLGGGETFITGDEKIAIAWNCQMDGRTGSFGKTGGFAKT
jgi:hypothetical protein